MATESVAPTSNEEVFQKIEAYPWDSDEEYQHGLQAILGASPTAEQAKHLTLRARCFYFARKFSTTVDFAAYQQWHGEHLGVNGTSQTTQVNLPASELPVDTLEEKPPYPLSFNEIVELITTGKPIPGIKEIPDTVLEGQASESTSSRRKKPWEA